MSAEQSESYLWYQFKQGNHAAFESIYRTHYPGLFRFALRFYPDQSLAEQSIQELFVRLWERRSQLASVSSPRAYLYTALRRELIQQKKKGSVFDALTDHHPESFVYSPQDLCIQEEENHKRQADMAQALNSLPVRQREILYLKYYEELSYAEIANVMGIRYQSVVNLIFRAIISLKSSEGIRHYAPYYRAISLVFCLLFTLFF